MDQGAGAKPERDERARQAAMSVQAALGQVRSREEAERLLDEIERRTEGRTQADADAAPPAADAVEGVEREVARAEGREEPVAALQSVVEQTSGAQGEGSEQLASAVQEVMARPEGDSLEPHEHLRRAVLRRMTPLQAWDAGLYIAVNRLPRNEPFVRAMRGVSTVAWHGGGWVVGALLLAAADRERGRAATREMVPALLVTNTLVERVVKLYFRRRRPFITLVQALVVGRKPGSWSFPSGHSATSFACASALGRRYRRARPALYALASVVAFSRVYLGHHYPTDVLSGATIGELLSRSVVLVVRRFGPGARS